MLHAMKAARDSPISMHAVFLLQGITIMQPTRTAPFPFRHECEIPAVLIVVNISDHIPVTK